MNIIKKIINYNFTKGREGSKIQNITLHTAVDGQSTTSLFNWFNRPTTKASSHYYVGKNGQIEQYVEDQNTAWTNSNWESNKRSITIEFWDGGNPNDSIRTDALYNSGGWLIAELSKKYGIPLIKLDKSQAGSPGIDQHNFYSQKSCPAGLDIDRLINIAKEYLKKESQIIENIPEWKKNFIKEELSIKPTQDFNLYNIITGEIKKTYKLEDFLNKKIGTSYKWGDWIMTEYSYKNNIPNAFKLSEVTFVKPEQKIVPEWKKNFVKTELLIKPKQDFNLYNIETGEIKKTYSLSEIGDKKIKTMYKWQDWIMTEYSYERDLPNAFKLSELIYINPETQNEPEWKKNFKKTDLMKKIFKKDAKIYKADTLEVLKSLTSGNTYGEVDIAGITQINGELYYISSWSYEQMKKGKIPNVLKAVDEITEDEEINTIEETTEHIFEFIEELKLKLKIKIITDNKHNIKYKEIKIIG